ncbi:hypothetical protein B7P43_G10089 [Cryptotermes secundus]|uniref:Uncharacterized protein n=1 Tax=Cryptotermes secundus TaxID=105785 RepID=A0A2J7QUY7_9NEOP|nr:hypothetical protein B7P43_G10089 [Cryptotermes secundus]
MASILRVLTFEIGPFRRIPTQYIWMIRCEFGLDVKRPIWRDISILLPTLP